MCPYAIFRNMSIFLIVVTTIPCVIVPIISVTISWWVTQLVRCLDWYGSAFTCSMSKILIVITISIEFLYCRGFEVALVHLVSLLLIFIFSSILRIMVPILSFSNFSCMSYFSTMMASRFSFCILLFSIARRFSFSIIT